MLLSDKFISNFKVPIIVQRSSLLLWCGSSVLSFKWQVQKKKKFVTICAILINFMAWITEPLAIEIPLKDFKVRRQLLRYLQSKFCLSGHDQDASALLVANVWWTHWGSPLWQQNSFIYQEDSANCHQKHKSKGWLTKYFYKQICHKQCVVRCILKF